MKPDVVLALGKPSSVVSPQILSLALVFFASVRTGFFCHILSGAKGVPFFADVEKRQHEIKLNSARRARARDKSSLKSSIRVNCHTGHREKA